MEVFFNPVSETLSQFAEGNECRLIVKQTYICLSLLPSGSSKFENFPAKGETVHGRQPQILQEGWTLCCGFFSNTRYCRRISRDLSISVLPFREKKKRRYCGTDYKAAAFPWWLAENGKRYLNAKTLIKSIVFLFFVIFNLKITWDGQ